MSVDKDNCNEKCHSCPLHGDCSKEQTIPKAKMEPFSSSKHIIGIVSGKGGVGKSFVSSYLAVSLARQGYKVGILDADISGPSIGYTFGLKYKVLASGEGIMLPGETKKYKIKVISSNMLLDDDNKPIIYKGPLLGELVLQFYSQVYYGKLDYLLIDMPPGTTDIAINVFQSIPLDGIITVTTPQSLVSMIVEKANNMAKIMNVKILGLVSNMSYIICPDCHKKIELYGKDHIEEIAKKFDIQNTLTLPFNSEIPQKVDEGKIEDLVIDEFDEFVKKVF